MSAVIQQAAGVAPAGAPLRSEGVWHAAWRRFRKDRVGMVSLVVVAAFGSSIPEIGRAHV